MVPLFVFYVLYSLNLMKLEENVDRKTNKRESVKNVCNILPHLQIISRPRSSSAAASSPGDRDRQGILFPCHRHVTDPSQPSMCIN